MPIDDNLKNFIERTMKACYADICTNARLKMYYNKSVLQVSNDYIFSNGGKWERADGKPMRNWSVSAKGKAKDPSRSILESRRRACRAVFDIALCNRFTYMFTWTLDGSQIYDKSGRPIFNMTDWKFGFSTCVPLDENYESAVGYIVKYITKADVKIFGKWYLSSRNLRKKPLIYDIEPVDYDDFKLRNPDLTECQIYRDICLLNKDLEGGFS